MALSLVSRALLAAAGVFFALGLERLLNAWLLHGIVDVQSRVVIGLALAGVALLLLSAAGITRKRPRGR